MHGSENCMHANMVLTCAGGYNVAECVSILITPETPCHESSRDAERDRAKVGRGRPVKHINKSRAG